MEARIIQIGNSRGIRIPKSMLEQAGMLEKVQLSADGNRIIIEAVNSGPRSDWKTKFAALANETSLSSDDSDWLDADLDTSSNDPW